MKTIAAIFLTTVVVTSICIVRVKCQNEKIKGSMNVNRFDNIINSARASRPNNPIFRINGHGSQGTRGSRRPDPRGGWRGYDRPPNQKPDTRTFNFWRGNSRPQYPPRTTTSGNMTHNYRLNVRNSGQPVYRTHTRPSPWRYGKAPVLKQLLKADKLTNIKRPRSPVLSVPKHRRPGTRETPARHKPISTSPLSQSNNKSHGIITFPKALNTKPNQSAIPLKVEKVLQQQKADTSLFDVYKKFYNKTMASCKNGKTYVCKSVPTNKTMEPLQCIPLRMRCDGTQHCPLGDDEHGCLSPICKPLQVRCREGTCATACDGVPECNQLEDEIFCAPLCIDGQLRCPDGNCASVCDGISDCENGEDEFNCREIDPGHNVCNYGEVLCSDKETCAKVCDGVTQCEDGADEQFTCT